VEAEVVEREEHGEAGAKRRIEESGGEEEVGPGGAGSEEAQRNFLLKTLVEVQREDIRQFCIFNLGDGRLRSEATSEFDLMGLYQHLSENAPYTQVPTPIAIAHKSVSDLLYQAQYDPLQTETLLLEGRVRGAAFAHPDGSYTYALWAATFSDLNELAAKSFTFPPLIEADSLEIYHWDHSRTGETTSSASRTLQLDACPVFVRVKKASADGGGSNEPEEEPPTFSFSTYPNPYSDSTNIIFQLKTARKVSMAIYNSQGHLIRRYYQKESLDPGVYRTIFDEGTQAGLYICQLEVDEKTHTFKLVKTYEE
ncbi:MAG: T9SS type A sorting domain-containing protein, partial [Bacteroidota bacterium]